MKKFALVLAVAFSFVASTQASVVLVDDFSTYNVGESINGQGTWAAQVNSNWVPDDSHSTTVETSNGSNVAVVTAREIRNGSENEFGNTNVIANFGMNIADKGTLYFKYQSLTPASNFALTLNGRDNGYAFGGLTPPDNNPGGQNPGNPWGDASSIIRINPGEAGQTARNEAGSTGSYPASQLATESLQWYEMWIQIDNTNKIVKYFRRDLGDAGAPVALLHDAANTSDEWMMRNTTYAAITNMSIYVSPSPVWNCTVGCDFTAVAIGDVGLDASGWSLNSVGAITTDVVPEPASLSILALGSILAIRRR